MRLAVRNGDPSINLALATGCRRGELCGLSWSDIDETLSMVEIRYSLC